MTNGQISRRTLLGSAVLIGGGAVVLNACTGGGSSSNNPTPGKSGPKPGELPDPQAPTIITDRSEFPTEFKESPDFAALVQQGKLPPVAERVSQDPIVIKPLNEIGKYGGVLRGGMIEYDPPGLGIGPDGLLTWDSFHVNVRPNIALSFEMSSDLKELTLHLRRGMKWSDGEPFTADDIIGWREDLNLNEDIGYPSAALTIDGKQVQIEKVDDLTVVFRSPVPYGSLPEQLAGLTDVGQPNYYGQFAGGGYAPMHYLKQFLPKYVGEDEANKKAKDAGFDGWVSYVLNQNSYYVNPDLPTLSPYRCTRSSIEEVGEFSANPYSIWVDNEGNQLPYIPKITYTNTKDQQVLTLNVVSGKYDYQDRGLSVQSLPLLIQNQERSGYTVYRSPDEVMDLAIILNLALDGELGELIRTVEFRRALSLAIDRNQANETYFLGTGQASATMCADTSPYFPGAEWRLKWAQHDVDQANQLLDGLGLTKRDGAGHRLLPSGKPLTILLESTNTKADFPTMGEMIRRHWQTIGINSISNVADGSLLIEKAQANKAVATVNNVYGVEDPFLSPSGFLPVTGGGVVGSMMGYRYTTWFLSGGKDGTEPPASLDLLKEAVTKYKQGNTLAREDRSDLGKALFQMHADQVWTIGVVGFSVSSLGLYCVNNKLGNVPTRFVNTLQSGNESVSLDQTFYFK